LLGRTDFPLDLIAILAGFRSFRRFEAAFRQQEGVSPGAYRRRHGCASRGRRFRPPRPAAPRHYPMAPCPPFLPDDEGAALEGG
jgi:AraC-like DNA-binding protein